jgi:uncharacterized protein
MFRIFSMCLLIFLGLTIDLQYAQNKFHRVELKNTEVRYIHSDIVNEDYRLDIRLPSGYSSSDTVYPLVLGTDADAGFPVLAGIYDVLSFPQHKIPESIIVSVGYKNLENIGNFIAWRTRDLTPLKRESTENYWQNVIMKLSGEKVKVESGGAENFFRFITEELIPFLGNNYRVSGFKALIGYSYGAVFSLYVLFNHPHSFDAYYAGSPSFKYGDGLLFKYEKEYASKYTDMPVKLFISVGGLEKRTGDMNSIGKILVSRNYPGLELRTSVIEGRDHQSAVPDAYTQALMFILNK